MEKMTGGVQLYVWDNVRNVDLPKNLNHQE
jgi:hypothetical protein